MAFVLFATGADVPSANVQVHQFAYIRANNAAELAEIRAAMPRLGYGVTPTGVTVFMYQKAVALLFELAACFPSEACDAIVLIVCGWEPPGHRPAWWSAPCS